MTQNGQVCMFISGKFNKEKTPFNIQHTHTPLGKKKEEKQIPSPSLKNSYEYERTNREKKFIGT